ncbi:unnamed protein product [Kuraishia capsulata CBS 1993]|uniref:Phosphatidate cytidylyltransferase, mitochondrial n=1 Tax=Kuraishia capsulata CBS 1993 TaxID=1382522 RepID=W6MNF4_9ASCO|nr:uncharacterized protein KUCA_T00004176001 [Kuraishia capsulata CBS 1993]CDK28194.1 unnamed protein product [Kuraishia capsulata CBS 1993]
MLSSTTKRACAQRRINVKLLARLESSTPGSVRSESGPAGSRTAPKEIDPVLLDQLFRGHKPRRFPAFERIHKQDQEEKDRFAVIDENLSKFKSNSPVNFNYYLRNLADLKTQSQLPYKFGENQLVKNDPEMEKYLKMILWEFQAPVRFAFGYGSKVFGQGSGASSADSMIDMNFAVSYPDHWHSLNMQQFPNHYSGIRRLGAHAISTVQEWGAGVYFNPYVTLDFKRAKTLTSETPAKSQMMKYGVTSIDRLISDLINWDTLYLSGRLHKPVAIIRNSPNVQLLNQFNLTNAIKLSLLLLSERHSTENTVDEFELYKMITGLSYIGDPRVQMKGENPHKIENIVENQFTKFRWMYLPLLENYFPSMIQMVNCDKSQGFDRFNTPIIYKFKVDVCDESKASLIVDLPKAFRRRLYAKYAEKYGNDLANDIVAQEVLGKVSLTSPETSEPKLDLSFIDLQKVRSFADLNQLPTKDWEYTSNAVKVKGGFAAAIAKDEDLKTVLVQVLKDTIYGPALAQSLKGVVTAGLGKSIKYALEKRKKYNNGKAA